MYLLYIYLCNRDILQIYVSPKELVAQKLLQFSFQGFQLNTSHYKFTFKYVGMFGYVFVDTNLCKKQESSKKRIIKYGKTKVMFYSMVYSFIFGGKKQKLKQTVGITIVIMFFYLLIAYYHLIPIFKVMNKHSC